MGCPWLNNFIKDYFNLFYNNGIISYPKKGKVKSKYNIIDFSGKAFKDIVVKLNFYQKSKSILTFDELYQSLDFMIRKIISMNPSAEWYIVFDPIIRAKDSIVEQLKLSEWQKRSQHQILINNIPSSKLVQLANYFYWAFKIDPWYNEDSENIHFIMSKHESDIMCGSICKRIQKYTQDIQPEDITVFSTDSDLIIHAYPFNFYNLGKGYILDTFEFFNSLGENHPEYLPARFGCDYTKFSSRKFINSEILNHDYYNLVDNKDLTEEEQLLIAFIFSHEDKIEYDYNRTEYGDDIILSGRISNKTVFVRLQDIEHFVYIAKLPGYSSKEFEEFLDKYLPKDFEYSKTKLQESTTSLLQKDYTYYKLSSTKSQIEWLVKCDEFTLKTEKPNFGYAVFKRNNYLLNDEEPQSKKYQISKFYRKYLDEYYSIKPKKLSGIDYLIYPYLEYPFRCQSQDIAAIQAKYKINCFDTFVIPKKYKPHKCNKYSCDYIYYLPISEFKNCESTLQQDLKNYWSLMFDIENYVYLPEHHDNQPATTKKLDHAINKPHSDYVDKFINHFSNDEHYKKAFYDQTEIICISFIEQNFNNEIGKKIALVRPQVKDYNPDKLLEKINFDYYSNQKASDYQYADEIICCNSEKQLLKEVIKLMSNKKYHVIQHFNGWNFDERMIMSRMCLYGLLDDYLYAMKTIKTLAYDKISYKGFYKLGSFSDKHDLCQMKDPLKFSLDVYQINLHDNTDAQKHDDNSLNGLLSFHGLGLKGDVSYQDLNNWFDAHDLDNLIKGWWYCQRDSLQQAKLQAYLKIILNYVQFTNLCQIGLQTSVQNAVGAKVTSTAYQFYLKQNQALLDTVPPMFRGQQVKVVKAGRARMESLKNVGGEVICFKPGFDTYISAVDAASMYPAQVEANNISNNCMLYPHQLIYILDHPEEFKIKDIKVEFVQDMYSPYNTSWTKIKQLEDLHQSSKIDDSKIHYHPTKDENKKDYRYRVIITTKDKTLTYEQFYFLRNGMHTDYNYVFYLQGKDSNGVQYSPRSTFLTTFRFLRKGVKKQLKEAKDVGEKEFLDGKQGAIKICMNSEYGGSDIDCYWLYELIGPSAITFQSRCIIQNCRDCLLHQEHDINPRIYNDVKSAVEIYNTFVNKTIKSPEILVELSEDKIVFPKISMKYQDTDSNYFIMDLLDSAVVKKKYSEKKQERYVKTNILGLFNDAFRAYVNSTMNKFPLEFGFEGAFYKAYHIQKKMYLGQKVEQYTCVLDENDDLVEKTKINEDIITSDFNLNDDIYKYLGDKHIKITGLSVIKRNTTNLLKRYYLKLIEIILNQQFENIDSLKQCIVKFIKEFKEQFNNLPMSQFVEFKKMKDIDLSKKYVLKFNKDNPEDMLGLGNVMYSVVGVPYGYEQDRFTSSSFAAEDCKFVVSQKNLNVLVKDSPEKPYLAYYIQRLVKNLFVFIAASDDAIIEDDSVEDENMISLDEISGGDKKKKSLSEIIDKQIKPFLEEHSLVQFGCQRPDYKYSNINQLVNMYEFYLNNFKGDQQFGFNNIIWSSQKLKTILTKWKNRKLKTFAEKNLAARIEKLLLSEID